MLGPSSRSPKHAFKVGGQVQIFLPQPFLELPNMEFESFKRGRGKFSCFGQALKKPKKL